MAPIPPPYPQTEPPRVALDPTAQDNEHMRLLSLACTIAGIVLALLYSFPLIHVALGLMMVTGAIPADKNGPPPALFGWFFVIFGLLFVLAGWLVGGLTVYAGRCLARREKKTFIQVMAAILCLFMPIGTILGVFILVVMSRPSVAAQFAPRPLGSPS